MKVFVTAKANAFEETIEQLDKNHFKISVVEMPVKGKANQAIISALARHFQVAKSQVEIISGFSSREKIFEISL